MYKLNFDTISAQNSAIPKTHIISSFSLPFLQLTANILLLFALNTIDNTLGDTINNNYLWICQAYRKHNIRDSVIKAGKLTAVPSHHKFMCFFIIITFIGSFVILG